MERIKRKSRPSVEGLEGRALLSTLHAQASRAAQSSNTQFNYTTPEGSRVALKLKGPGNLSGTSVDPAGELNLVFSGSTVFTTITGTVKGGTGQAPLASIRNANVPLNSLTGLNGELLGRVLLPSFNLIPGGVVNLLAGVQVFKLNSVAANSQVRLRDTPLNTTLGVQSYVNTVTGAGESYALLSSTSTGATSASSTGLASGTSIGAATGSSSSGLSVNGQGTLTPTAVGFGGGSVGAINGAIPIINTVGNGQNFLGTPGLSQSQVDQGRTRSFTTDPAGGTQLTSIAGTFMPGTNLIVPSDVSLPPHPVPPPGVIVTINHINGGPTANTPPLSHPQIYGYDARLNSLIRFDAANGTTLRLIPLPASASGVGGVSLASVGAELVVLVGIGQEVLAFDAVNGGPVGRFSTANLAGEGLTAVDGIAAAGQDVVLATAANPTAASPNGTVQAVNLARSLATGQAVPDGSPFSPGREFTLAGTLANVPGTGNVFALGSGFFDTAQPNAKQAGILTITPANGTLTEATRTAFNVKGATLPAGANSGIAGSSSVALGSLDSFLAVDAGVVNGLNLINLLTPNGLASEGSIALVDSNPLADLTQSFHPELSNSALIDVQGNIQSFTAANAMNFVINDAGNFNLLQIHQASNATVIGEPFSHVDIPIRNNVVITTPSRLIIGSRGGVTINPALKQVGPLFLP